MFLKEFKLYKGIKKPLVLFGLKGKYVYWGMGTIASGLFIGGILNSIFGVYATVVGVIIALGGTWGVFYLQDKVGLYRKTKTKQELLVMPKKIKRSRKLKR